MDCVAERRWEPGSALHCEAQLVTMAITSLVHVRTVPLFSFPSKTRAVVSEESRCDLQDDDLPKAYSHVCSILVV
ncbi:hypothetical protein DPEC_G00345100 [Dallia pectoralis]|uniref:Uncharacterized protein n=1 Tax=Dallia pectoralis TaxID=75939 RepID=A0ACC2F3J5_DALPE|nr:hypothetical protein DPEC_G00345100 [Dallia pectoralis]